MVFKGLTFGFNKYTMNNLFESYNIRKNINIHVLITIYNIPYLGDTLFYTKVICLQISKNRKEFNILNTNNFS
jgi:hypothetical protein